MVCRVFRILNFPVGVSGPLGDSGWSLCNTVLDEGDNSKSIQPVKQAVGGRLPRYMPPVTWATSVPILVFPGLSVLDLGPMYVTDRQTSDKSIA